MRKFILSLTVILNCFSGIAQWNYVGVAGISNDWTVENDIKTDTSGTPVIVFVEHSAEYKASCLKFNGNQWEQVGEETFSNFSILSILDFEIDDKNNYFILYLDSDYNTSCIRFKGDAWEFVGSQYILTEYSPYQSLALDTAGIAHIALQTQSGFSIIIENGDSWMPVTINGLPGIDRYFDLVFDKENVAFLGYCSTNGKEPNCAKLVNDNWEPVGTAISSIYFVGETSLHITNNHQLYIGFSQPDLGFYKFDALSNNWTKIETSSFRNNYTGIWDITSDSRSNIYISTLSDRARCYTYDGSSWEQLGNSGISEAEAGYIHIAVNKYDELYATFNDFTEGKAIVKKHDYSNGINYALQNEDFKVYPNPAIDKFCIELNEQKFTVMISDIEGALVYKDTNGLNRLEIDVKLFNKGLYIVRIRSGEGIYLIRKLIVL